MSESSSVEINPGLLYTARETQTYLRISRTTLWHFEKRGILKPVRVGGKILHYRGQDILRLVNGELAKS